MAINDQDFLVYSSQYVTKVVEATAYKSSHYALAELVDNSIQSSLENNSKICEVEIAVIQKENKIDKVLILDNAGSKGTGMWSTKAALDLGEANTMMSSAVFARYLSSMKQQRTFLAHRKPNPKQLNSFDLLKLKEAYSFARTINHIQGFNLIEAASKKYNWNYIVE